MPVLKVENISKLYRLGEVGTGTISQDLNRWWARTLGKEDPYSLVGQTNDRSQKADSDYVWALKDINFEVEKGEILGIIGRNGAGKSTLLKILSQITSPTNGVIKTKGRIASLLEVGTGMHPEMTARENIYLNGAILGMTKKEIAAKFDDIITFSGCTMYVDTPLKRFSSGMRVRLGFAVAAFLEPEILIVDEVLAVGDAEFQRKAIGKMKEISNGYGRTVLFVSHNMASISNLCTRTIVLKNGGTIFDGPTPEGVEFYLNQHYGNQHIEDLSTRKDRNTIGRFKFTAIRALDRKKNKVNTFASGNDYFFEVEFESTSQNALIGLRLLITDMNGVHRLLLNGAFVSDFPISIKANSKGSVTFEIPNFPLPQGEYSVQLSAFSEDGVEDDIENVLKINCEGGDYFKRGKLPSVRDGLFIPYKFEAKC